MEVILYKSIVYMFTCTLYVEISRNNVVHLILTDKKDKTERISDKVRLWAKVKQYFMFFRSETNSETNSGRKQRTNQI